MRAMTKAAIEIEAGACKLQPKLLRNSRRAGRFQSNGRRDR